MIIGYIIIKEMSNKSQTMKNYSNAAKALIIKNGAVLLLKRRPNDAHKPAQWDIPGGRLAPGESPFLGLARDV